MSVAQLGVPAKTRKLGCCNGLVGLVKVAKQLLGASLGSMAWERKEGIAAALRAQCWVYSLCHPYCLQLRIHPYSRSRRRRVTCLCVQGFLRKCDERAFCLYSYYSINSE